MSYTVANFKTKKALKEAVKNYLDNVGKPVRCYQPALGVDLNNFTGIVYLEGPHYPEPHKWYAQAEMNDGIVVKVK